MKTVYLDTNSFYELLSAYGFSFKYVNTGDSSNIDYCLLKNKFDELLIKKQIGFSSAVFFEVISHHRKRMTELRKILSFTKRLLLEKNHPLVINHNGPYFNHKAGTQDDTISLVQEDISNSEVEMIVNEKIESESKILGNCIYFISLAYVFSRYEKNKDLEEVMNLFTQSMGANDCENVLIVTNIIQSNIKSILKKAYENNCEKKSIRKIFSKLLAMGIATLLIQLDLIKNKIDKNPEGKFFYEDTFGNDEESIEAICNRWNKSDSNFKESLKHFIDESKANIKKKNYSQTQVEYLGMVIHDLFTQQTKMDKNDACDFWNLCVIDNDHFLLSFDNQIIEAIKIGNPLNYSFIEPLLIPKNNS